MLEINSFLTKQTLQSCLLAMEEATNGDKGGIRTNTERGKKVQLANLIDKFSSLNTRQNLHRKLETLLGKRNESYMRFLEQFVLS